MNGNVRLVLSSVGLALVLHVGCRSPESEPDAGIRVVASIRAVALILDPIVGPSGTVSVLLPDGASPHAYEPRPSDIRRLADARLMVDVGRGVDGWASGLSDVPTLHLLDAVADSVRTRATTHADPHVWLDPQAVRTALPALVRALCETAPASCDGFGTRATAFDSALVRLTVVLRERLRSGRVTAVLSSGPFLAHFSARFGPPVIGVIERSEGVEPSPARIAAMIDRARDADAVLGQRILPDRAARAVAEAAGIPYVPLDPVGTAAGTPDYATLLADMVRSLEQLTPR